MPAFTRELDGVRDQVPQDAPQQDRVRPRCRRVCLHGEGDLLFRRGRRELVGDSRGKGGDIGTPPVRHDRACIEPRYVEKSVEQIAEPAPARLDLRDQVELLRVPGLLAQRREEKALRMQRLRQVVARGGEKARLLLARLLQCVALLAQFLHQRLVLLHRERVPCRDLDARTRRHEEGIGEQRADTDRVERPLRGEEDETRIRQQRAACEPHIGAAIGRLR